MPYQKSGIPLPENPDTTGYRCIALYLPDDDRYLEALAGQITELEKWTSWEKRGDDSAAVAGRVWKEANDKTWNELWTKGFIMTCENVQALIDAVLGIQSIMTSSNSALVNAINGLQLTLAPYDCIDCADRVYVDPVPIADPDPNNPPVGVDAAEWAAYLCRAMNYMWYEHVSRGGAQMILGITTGGGILSVAAASQILYATGIGAPLAFLGTIILAVGAIAVIYDQTTFELEIDGLADDVICAVVNSTGPGTAVDAMRQAMVDAGASQQIIDYVMSVTGTSAMNKLFSGDIVVPDEFVALFDCNTCGNDPPPVTGMYFEKMTNVTITYQNCTAVRVDNVITCTPTTDHPEVQVSGTPPAAGGRQFVGLYIEVVEATPGYNRYIFDKYPGGEWGAFYVTTGQKLGVRDNTLTDPDMLAFYATLQHNLQSTGPEDGDWRFGSETAFLDTIAVRCFWAYLD